MNLEQVLREYRQCGFSKQAVVHDACHDCPLFVVLLTEGKDQWTVCDLLAEVETSRDVEAAAEAPKDRLAEAQTQYCTRSEEKRRRYLFNRGCV